VKILSKEDARCLPCLREEEKLASSKLDVLSTPMGSVPMRYDACSYVRYKGENGKSDTAQKP
jgi:phage baseplate assembly protein W